MGTQSNILSNQKKKEETLFSFSFAPICGLSLSIKRPERTRGGIRPLLYI